MFSIDSNVFISRNDFFIGDQNVIEIKEELDKNELYYVMSYHNGFKQYDYTQLQGIDVEDKSLNLVNLVIRNPQDKEYDLLVDTTQKIYTQGRGYVEALKTSFLDIFTDVNNLPCKLVEKNILGVTNSMLFDLSVKYNKSAFINGILCKTK